VEESECGQGSGARQRVLGKERDGLMRLLAPREMMMMMIYTVEVLFFNFVPDVANWKRII